MLYYLAILLFAACSNPSASTESASRRRRKPRPTKTKSFCRPNSKPRRRSRRKRGRPLKEPEMLRVKGRIALADDRTWRVGVRTLGSVTAVYANLGDHVQKGQILARYHADEVRDSRAQYRAALSELDRAKAAVAQAQRNRDRAQRLLELKAGSVQQVEQAQQDLVTAQAVEKKAEIEVDRGRDLLEDDLKVPADPPANRQDETEDEVPIIAPADGYIIEKNVTPGKTVELSIGHVCDRRSIEGLDARRGPPGRSGKASAGPVRLRHAARTGWRSHWPARSRISGQEFDPNTRVMQVRIELANPNNRLRPEMLANAEFPVGGRQAGAAGSVGRRAAGEWRRTWSSCGPRPTDSPRVRFMWAKQPTARRRFWKESTPAIRSRCAAASSSNRSF